MPIFKLSAPKTMRLLSGHILQKCIKFHLKPSKFEKKSPWGLGNLRTHACRGGKGKGEGVKGFLPLKGGGTKG